jgi:ATP-dependent exoDNAse (exonuclease V) alpha subunit
MAIFHFNVTTVSRAHGANRSQSAVARAAYHSAAKLYDASHYKSWNFSDKAPEVVHSEILAPPGAPAWDRETLWNMAERAEHRKNSRVAREVVIAIPNELTQEQGIAAMRHFAQREFVQRGMIADLSIHEQPGNLHAHVLLTTRAVGPDGFGRKVRDWDKRHQLVEWRQGWERIANLHLERAGSLEPIDHRRYSERGIDLQPTFHLGRAVKEMDDRGEHTRAMEYYNQISLDREMGYGR